MLRGKRGCDEDKSWKVYIHLDYIEDEFTVAEQLTRKEAEDYLESIMKMIEDKNDYITLEVPANYREEIIIAKINKEKIVRVSMKGNK